MVKRGKKDSRKTPARQGFQETHSEPNKIRASTPYDFEGKNLSPYGGLLPVATMLEKLGFQQLLESTIRSKRVTRVMSLYKFALGLVLGFYVGFQRLNQMRFIARDPILTGILGVDELPPQSTLWRFLAGLHINVAGQILKIQQAFRRRFNKGPFWRSNLVCSEGGYSGSAMRCQGQAFQVVATSLDTALQAGI